MQPPSPPRDPRGQGFGLSGSGAAVAVEKGQALIQGAR